VVEGADDDWFGDETEVTEFKRSTQSKRGPRTSAKSSTLERWMGEWSGDKDDGMETKKGVVKRGNIKWRWRKEKS